MYSSTWTGVDQDVDRRLAAGGFGADLVELVAGRRRPARSRCGGGSGHAVRLGRRLGRCPAGWWWRSSRSATWRWRPDPGAGVEPVPAPVAVRVMAGVITSW